MALDREQVVSYLKGQGCPHCEQEGIIYEFMHGNEAQAGEVRGVNWQGMYDEAVVNNYAIYDVDRWFNIVKAVRMPLKYETAMAITNALYEYEDVDSLELPAGEQVVCEMAIDRWMDRQGIELSDAEYHRLKAAAWRDADMVFEGPGFDMVLHEKMNDMQKRAEGVHFGIGGKLVHPFEDIESIRVSCFDADMVRGKKRAMDMLALEAKAEGWHDHIDSKLVSPYTASMFICSYKGGKFQHYIEQDEDNFEFKNGKLVMEDLIEDVPLEGRVADATERSQETDGRKNAEIEQGLG